MPKPLENGSGLPDPTAFRGEKEIEKEEQRVADLVRCLRYVARMAGFEIINRVEFRDVKTKRTYK